MKYSMQAFRFIIMVILLCVGVTSIFSQLGSDTATDWAVIVLSFGGLVSFLLIEWFLYLRLPPNMDNRKRNK